ncbi:hypothetical protein [uncultured Duncaniella sp.]|uniref:hypothetical protein n=1 Tax=uncultured Duncaniella sp. TaxID=2768039 RepID=UPI0026753BF9|nr:hypothetical protein [uncultured Duncaniella sp.]
MYSFHWTVKAVKQVGKLPTGTWVEITKTTTSANLQVNNTKWQGKSLSLSLGYRD